MIRAHNTLRADSACFSSDLLTGPEAYAERQLPKGFVAPEKLVYRDGVKKWSEIPKIANELLKLKG